MKSLVRTVALGATVAFATACASVGGGTGGTVTGGPEPATPGVIWPVKTREHVDLWLHGFAMLQEDTTFVPFFKRGYSTNMIVLKNRANVVTQLDANRDRLRARLAGQQQRCRDHGRTGSSARQLFRSSHHVPPRAAKDILFQEASSRFPTA